MLNISNILLTHKYTQHPQLHAQELKVKFVCIFFHIFWMSANVVQFLTLFRV